MDCVRFTTLQLPKKCCRVQVHGSYIPHVQTVQSYQNPFYGDKELA